MQRGLTRLVAMQPLLVVASMIWPSPAFATEPVNWRADYNAARKESAEKGLLLLLVVGSDNCFYCRKLEAGPLRDPGVASQVAANFIPLKLNATRDPALAKALKVQLYPTIVLAGPDGKIHAFIEGYIEPERLADQLKRAVTAATTADWIARDFEQATKALAAGDYPRAVSLLKGIMRESADKPVGVKSRQVLDDIERLATGRLVRARELEQRGLTQEALDTLAEAVKTYAGTQSAADAATLMTGLAANPENQEKLRTRAARDLLAVARDNLRTKDFYGCLQKCEQLATVYSDLPEGNEATRISAEIKGNPDRLAAACDQMNERTAAMYLTLAEAWNNKGQTAEAVTCYEKVIKLCPQSRQGDMALSNLTKLKANGMATPASLRKP